MLVGSDAHSSLSPAYAEQHRAPVVGRQNVLRASAEAFSYACRHSGIGPMLLLFVVTTIGTRGFIELFADFADRCSGVGRRAWRC